MFCFKNIYQNDFWEIKVLHFFPQREWYLNGIFYAKKILKYKRLWILKKNLSRQEVTWRKRPYNHEFRESWWKKLHFFSIFFKLSQMLYNDVKTVPKCFATLKSTSKASEHILESFEKHFLIEFSTFRSHFLLMELTNPLKMAIYEGFQNLKAFSRWRIWLNMIEEVSSDTSATFCRADCV